MAETNEVVIPEAEPSVSAAAEGSVANGPTDDNESNQVNLPNAQININETSTIDAGSSAGINRDTVKQVSSLKINTLKEINTQAISKFLNEWRRKSKSAGFDTPHEEDKSSLVHLVSEDVLTTLKILRTTTLMFMDLQIVIPSDVDEWLHVHILALQMPR